MSDLAPRIEYFNAPDRYRLAVRVWDVVRPLGRLVFVHGLISHGGWYPASCRHLARQGFEVHFVDRRGSGLNAEGRGDVDDHSTWLADIESYLEHLPAGLPTMLMGMSWGGKLTAAIAKRRPDLVAGIGMLCPGLFAKQMPNRAKQWALLAAKAAGLGHCRLTIPLQCPRLFTDSPSWRSYIAHDPLTLREVTVRFAVADMRLTRFATTDPEQITVPTLLMLAGKERIVENRRVLDLCHRMGSRHKQVIEYRNAAHTLEFEPDPTQYFNDLCQWAGEIAIS